MQTGYARRSTTGYCAFVEKNLVPWTSKKQSVISRSSVKLEYHEMTDLTCDLVWVKDLSKLDFTLKSPIDVL